MRKVVTPNQLYQFSKRWPCSEFPEDLGVSFEYDTNGQLVDIEWFDGILGRTVCEPSLSEETERALLAVSQDAQAGLIGAGPA